MARVLTLNLWSYNSPYDYTTRRSTTRGAAPGSIAATQPAPGGHSWPIRRGLILNLLQNEHPDIAGLQEVSRHERVEEGVSTAHQLGHALGWHVLFADGDGPPQASGVRNGLAILSPHPLRELGRITLPDGLGSESYLCLAGEVHTIDGPIIFLTTHLSLAVGEAEMRTHQEGSVRRMLAFCRTLPPEAPVVICGDLNAEPGHGAIRMLLGEGEIDEQPNRFRDAAMLATGAPLPTMPSHAPTAPLDYIFVRNAVVHACRTAGTANAEGYFPSDHLGLVADIGIA